MHANDDVDPKTVELVGLVDDICCRFSIEIVTEAMVNQLASAVAQAREAGLEEAETLELIEAIIEDFREITLNLLAARSPTVM
ncbi:MAG: hypothetical protein JSS57_07215 [Proteobacteria bacterium]|nr:hypothetical protein [Pseudomonadota bacterium]